jgi:hypothetical protein
MYTLLSAAVPFWALAVLALLHQVMLFKMAAL